MRNYLAIYSDVLRLVTFQQLRHHPEFPRDEAMFGGDRPPRHAGRPGSRR